MASMDAPMVMDLLSSKKFKTLLALVVLSSTPLQGYIPESHYMWLVIAFCCFFISQGIADLGGELRKPAKCFCCDGKKPDPSAPKDSKQTS